MCIAGLFIVNDIFLGQGWSADATWDNIVQKGKKKGGNAKEKGKKEEKRKKVIRWVKYTGNGEQFC
jgi:hypothetical protein